MNTNGNIYTVIYTTLVVVLVAAVLATVSQVLAPRQDANVKAETISQMLAAAKFYEKSELDAMGNDKVLEAYRSAVKEAFLIKADGTLDRNLDIESCEIVGTGALKAQNKFIKNGQTDKVSIPVVIFDKDGQKVIVAAFYVLQSESCCQDGDFYLAAQLRVDGKSPFQLEVVAELLHEVVDIVHLVHGETWIVLLLASESDAQEDLLGVENIIVVEKR